MVTIYIYPQKRNGEYGNPVSLVLKNECFDGTSILPILSKMNPTQRITVVREELLPFAPDDCSGNCDSCVLKDNCEFYEK